MSKDETSAGAVIDDRFVLLRRLGRGGAATVWLAQDSALGKSVALKLVHAHLRRQPRALERFALEAEVLLDLEHPNIARCHAYRMDTVQPYIAMDFVEGHSLKEEIGRRAPAERHFTTELLVRLFSELASAVTYAHGQGVLHRDLSAANVLLDATGDEASVRVVDFGVAKLIDGDSSHATTLGRIIGTPASLAPEQAAGEEIDHRADIYSLGVLLFELLTLHRTWLVDGEGRHLRAYDGPVPQVRDNQPLELFRRICGAARPRVRSLRPELPEALEEVVTRALDPDRDARWSSVDALAEALRDALDDVVLAEADATYILERGRRRGSTIAPPLEPAPPTDATSVVPRRSSSIAVPTVEVALPAADPTVPLVMTSSSEPHDPTPIVEHRDPMIVTRPSLGSADVAFVGPTPDTTAVLQPTRRMPERSRRRGWIGAAVLVVLAAGLAVAALGPRSAEQLVVSEPSAPRVDSNPTARPPAVEPSEVEDPPPSKARAPKRRTKRRTARAVVVPEPEREPEPTVRHPELRRLLAVARRERANVEVIEALASGIESAAAKVPSEPTRRRIRRLTASSRLMADVDGLARALRDLEAATR